MKTGVDVEITTSVNAATDCQCLSCMLPCSRTSCAVDKERVKGSPVCISFISFMLCDRGCS